MQEAQTISTDAYTNLLLYRKYERGDINRDDEYVGYEISRKIGKILPKQHFLNLQLKIYESAGLVKINKNRLLRDKLYVYLGKIYDGCDIWWYDNSREIIFCNNSSSFDAFISNYVTVIDRLLDAASPTTTQLYLDDKSVLDLLIIKLEENGIDRWVGFSLFSIFIVASIIGICALVRLTSGKSIFQRRATRVRGFY